MIEFTVNAVPVAQPRHRVGTGASGRPRAYLPADHPVHGFRLDVWRVARESYPHLPLDGPVAVALLFVMPRPAAKRWKKRPMPREWHISKPDVDNLAKAFLDACNGILWGDDSQVCHLEIDKRIAAGDEQPHVAAKVALL